MRTLNIEDATVTSNLPLHLITGGIHTIHLPEPPRPLRPGPFHAAMVVVILTPERLVALKRRGFTEADFHRFHPGGRLGARLRRVEPVGDDLESVYAYLHARARGAAR